MFRWFAWCGRYRWRILGLLALSLLLGLNALAYAHARALTHFVPHGRAKTALEDLTLGDKVSMALTGPRLARPASTVRPGEYGLPWEVHHLPGGTQGSLEAWYIPQKKAKTLVLMLHGYLDCKASLLPEAKALHEMGYDCFLLDFCGSGGSSGNRTTIGHAEAEEVARAVQYIRATWPGHRLVLFGHSMGSAAALRALGQLEVEVDAAILQCPFGNMLQAVRTRFVAVKVPAFPLAELIVFWGGVQHGFNGFAHNPADYARGVHCPVLLLHGRLDPRTSVEEVQTIEANLAGTTRFIVFEQCGHESYIQKDPQRWKQLVRSFLQP